MTTQHNVNLSMQGTLKKNKMRQTGGKTSRSLGMAGEWQEITLGNFAPFCFTHQVTNSETAYSP